MANILVYAKQAVNKIVLETLTANQKGVHNRLSVALVTSVFYTIHKIVNTAEFVGKVLDTVIDSLGFLAPKAALVRPKQ